MIAGLRSLCRGIFTYALDSCGAFAESSVMIGDNYDADICGAKNVGWRTIFYNKNGESGTFESAMPWFILLMKCRDCCNAWRGFIRVGLAFFLL